MKAMIMAAGVGSRLMPLTADIPKPMVPVGNRPLMENIVKLLQEHGFTQLIANLHYYGDIISNYFGDGSSFGLEIAYSKETELLGTAGGVKKCEWFLDDTFVVISGDALTDLDLTWLLVEHKKNGALATIALKEVKEVERFGVVNTDEHGKIRSFQEKPRRSEALSNKANTGIYVFEPEIFGYIPANNFYDFGKQVFPHLVKIGAPFYGVPIEDYWCDIGSIDAYRQANIDILRGNVRVKSEGRIISKNGDGGKVLIGEDVLIGEGVKFRGNVIVGPGCRIDSYTEIQDSVIWSNTFIGSRVTLKECILGSGCRVGRSAVIKPGAAIASGCNLGANAEILPCSRVSASNTGALNLKQG